MTDSQQQFCLRWNNFQANITSQFEALRDDEDFVDVTFACDGRRLQAHKVVLSACSPYFKELFKVRNPPSFYLPSLFFFFFLLQYPLIYNFISIFLFPSHSPLRFNSPSPPTTFCLPLFQFSCLILYITLCLFALSLYIYIIYMYTCQSLSFSLCLFALRQYM